jgi:ATP-binding cassette subfamily C protein
MDIIRTFFGLLTPRERRNLYLLFCAVLVMAGLEVVSVASIMPFLSVAADPASVHENAYLAWAFEAFGFADTNSFLIALGLGALAALVVSNLFIIFTMWAMQRYVWNRNHSLSRRLLRSYLYRPYEYFLTRNSAELGKNILAEVKEVTSNMLKPTLQGLAKGVVAVFIIGFLIFINPFVALAVATVLGAAYAVVYYVVRDRLDQAGTERVESNTGRYQFVREAFGGIKEVKLRGNEEVFLNQYDNPSRRYARVQAQYRVTKKAPRYILEMIAFGGIILIAIYLIAVENDIRQVIPMLGLYAFAGYRLMPALQQAFKGVASARFNISALQTLSDDLEDHYKATARNLRTNKDGRNLNLTNSLVLDSVYFTYPDADNPAIKNLSLQVPARSTVGFCGKTGSGKTTTVDLILGLLRPEKGSIVVDGMALSDENLEEWQDSIGYVPQQIYLSDDTIARNIAFGVPENEIDIEKVRDAARRAHIYDFIEKGLPNQWSSIVGERGVKLSGGQRQRIGIARALYHQPTVLVLDEATSALDQETEASVMEAVYGLEGHQTVLLIAHRLSTVRRADSIIMLEDGRKVEEGTYEELYQADSKFKSMAT